MLCNIMQFNSPVQTSFWQHNPSILLQVLTLGHIIKVSEFITEAQTALGIDV